MRLEALRRGRRRALVSAQIACRRSMRRGYVFSTSEALSEKGETSEGNVLKAVDVIPQYDVPSEHLEQLRILELERPLETLQGALFHDPPTRAQLMIARDK